MFANIKMQNSLILVKAHSNVYLSLLLFFLSGLFAFDGAPEIRDIMHTLVCVLCVLHMFITCVMWRNKPKRVLRGRFNNNLMNSIRELMHNSRSKC